MSETMNQRVVIWARGKKGQQVGRGECWDLADQALRKAGARSSLTTGGDDDYVWGDSVALKDVVPGDILQLRDHIVTTTTKTQVRFEDGSGFDDVQETFARRPHHTAIVDAVGENGTLVILEQHVKPLGDKVQRHTLPTRTAHLPPTTSHERMKHSSGAMKLAKVVETVTITVSGDIWAYRPTAK